jgi:hypothetical protein
MYGTIFNLKVKSGHHESLLRLLGEEQAKPKGMKAFFVMDPDNTDEWVGIVIFENKEAYIANAQSPEQHDRFLKIMEHLESEPKWTDGTYIFSETTN